MTVDMFGHENLPGMANVSVLPTAAVPPTGRGRWYGGTVEMPAYFSEDGQSFRPLVMMWVDADGLVAATEVCSPQADLKKVALDTLQHPSDRLTPSK